MVPGYRISWDEVHTRVRQELSKRLDASLYHVGLRPGGTRLRQTTSSGKFFFSQPDLPERVRLLRDHLPVEVGEILNEADEICRHRFRLLGYTGLDYGIEIDWHLDAVHGKRAPHKPWFKIDFLNFAEVGDHKITWELSRHQHLVTLAKAWLLAGEDRYVTELISQWYAWQLANPYPFGINWASSLEVAFRSLSWIWIRHLLAGCPALSGNFNTDLLRGLALNGRHIERYLSTYFSPNTHLLGEAVALFFIGVLCPQISAASRWREKGLQIVLEEAGRQVRQDGVYFEHSLYYHVYAIDLFMHTCLLAFRNRIEIHSGFDQVIQKMLAVVQALSQNGPPDGFGDDDGGRVFNPGRNRAEHMTDPLAIGAILFQSEKLRTIAALTEEAIWLFGEQATSGLRHRASANAPPHSEFFPEGGIYISASSGNCPQQIIIDAAPRASNRNGHGHADALSVKLSMHGYRWLIDPGTFCYISPGHERNSFRGSGAHNTLRVDGLDQAVPDGPFAWSELPSVRTECWINGDTFTLFSGSHTGFLRLSDPVLHRRFVVHLYNRFWMVRDIADGNEAHELETLWHLAADLTVTRTGDCFIASRQDRGDPFRWLALVAVNAPEWNCQMTSGHVSPAYGIREPAQVLRCRAELRLPAEHAMIGRALAEEHEHPGELVCVRAKPAARLAGATVYEYRDNQRTYFMIFGDLKTWNFGAWASNARFFYCCTEARRISHFIACQASFISCRGKPLVSHSRSVERFECWEGDGKRQISSSDQEALDRFSDAALESWDAGVVG